MNNYKPIDILITKGNAIGLEHYSFSPKEVEKMSDYPYVNAIGKLMYMQLCVLALIYNNCN